MILTYKYRIKSEHGTKSLARMSVTINQVWNFAVATQKKVQEDWKTGLLRKWPSHFDLTKLTAGTSKELGVHAQSVGGTCGQFAKSRDQHKKTPKFRKSFGTKRSLGWIPFSKQSRQITTNSIIYLGREYKVFGAERRPIPINAKGGCFVEDSRGRWYVCLQAEVEKDRDHGERVVGIDLGSKTLATCSDGQKIENPKNYRKLEEGLGKAQRAGNKKRVKAIHAKIKNSRQDHLHKESHALIKTCRIIFVGNVNASQLAKTKMAKSVLDAGWSTFRNMLSYKASRHGVLCAEVDEKFTTQTCSECGILPPSRPKGIAGLGVREWDCSCGAHHDRDINAARNILKLGQSALLSADEKSGKLKFVS